MKMICISLTFHIQNCDLKVMFNLHIYFPKQPLTIPSSFDCRVFDGVWYVYFIFDRSSLT